MGLRPGLRAPQTGARGFRAGLSRTREEGGRDIDGGIPDAHGEGPARRSRPGFSKERSSGSMVICPQPSRRSSVPLTSRTARSTTNRSRCRSPHTTGSGPRSSRASASRMRKRCIATISRNIHAMAGRCSVSSRPSRAGGPPRREVTADLAASWARADTWIRSSRF